MRRRMGSGMARISTLCPISSFLSRYINYGNALALRKIVFFAARGGPPHQYKFERVAHSETSRNGEGEPQSGPGPVVSRSWPETGVLDSSGSCDGERRMAVGKAPGDCG